jgi:cellulose biosynthesis protein BcsQ
MFGAEGLSITVFQTELHTRQVYVEAPAAGRVVVDYEPGSKGSLEVQSLTEEVLECLSQSSAVA